MKRQGVILNAYCQVKETDLRSLRLGDSNYKTSGKGKIMETIVKRSVVARDEVGVNRQSIECISGW